MKRKKTTGTVWNLSSRGESLFESLRGEPERIQVLIATTFLDNGLEQCLGLKFNKERVHDDLSAKLFNRNGGLLSSFAAKTWVARAFGFIDQETYEALEAVRAVRNACAHKNFKIALSDPDLEREMNRLRGYISTRCFGENWEHTAPARLVEAGVPVSHDAHLHFLLAAMQLFTCLSLIEFDLKRGSHQTTIKTDQ